MAAVFSFLPTRMTPLPQSEYLCTLFDKQADDALGPQWVFGGKQRSVKYVFYAERNTESEDVIKTPNCPKSISHASHTAAHGLKANKNLISYVPSCN